MSESLFQTKKSEQSKIHLKNNPTPEPKIYPIPIPSNLDIAISFRSIVFALKGEEKVVNDKWPVHGNNTTNKQTGDYNSEIISGTLISHVFHALSWFMVPFF